MGKRILCASCVQRVACAPPASSSVWDRMPRARSTVSKGGPTRRAAAQFTGGAHKPQDTGRALEQGGARAPYFFPVRKRILSHRQVAWIIGYGKYSNAFSWNSICLRESYHNTPIGYNYDILVTCTCNTHMFVKQ
jgi:hypothetical protein